MTAHVGGVPLEEILPMVTGAGGGLLLVRAWLVPYLRRFLVQVVAVAMGPPGGGPIAGGRCRDADEPEVA